MDTNEELVNWLIKNGSLKTPRVINAFKLVDRKNFCVAEYQDRAYLDRPLPIYENQTISQPTTVAMMTEALGLREGYKVLEIGSGSGYQAAILAEVVGKAGSVYSIERIHKLFGFAKKNLEEYTNVNLIEGDGSKGLAEHAPYNGIIVTAGAPVVPDLLKQQLEVTGKLIIPVGEKELQNMKVITRINETEFREESLGSFVFVPLIGEKGWEN